MQYSQVVTIKVNGKSVKATITVDAPDIDIAEDCVTAGMVLTAVANNQNMTYQSRHHKDRAAVIEVKPTEASSLQSLRLVA